MRSWSSLIKVSGALLVALLLIMGSFAGTNAGSSVQETAPATEPATTATALATAAGGEVDQSATAKCLATEVTVFTKSPRLHVKCEAPTDGILYFATATDDAQNAQRVLTVLTTALTNGKALSIVYNPSDLSGEAIGCLKEDCRLIISVSVLR